MDIESEKRFSILKRKLESLHYCQQLDINSAPLVEKLLTDLLNTTDGFQQIKNKGSKMNDELERVKLQVDPLKAENKKLMSDNNDLHFRIIKISEDFDSTRNTHVINVKRLEAERSDLRFIVAQKDGRIAELEGEIYQLKFKLDSMFNKFSRGLEQPAMPKTDKQGKFSVREMAEATQLARESDQVKELRSADENNRSLQIRVQELSAKNLELANDMSKVQEMIDARDHEISRLHSVQEPDHRLDGITGQYENEKMGKKVEQLQKQLDFLNEENNKLTSNFINASKELSFQQGSKREIDVLSKKIVSLEDQKNKYEKTIAKQENMNKRLNEQFENSKKHVVNETMSDISSMHNTIASQEKENESLRKHVEKLQSIESAYNSDKKMFYKTIEDLTNEIDALKENSEQVEKAKAEYEQLYLTNEEKQQVLQELCEQMKIENNKLKSGYKQVGEDTQFFTGKLKEMMALLESQELEKKQLADELAILSNHNASLNQELEKKNQYLQNFAEGLENVKSNVEQERTRNEQVSGHIESLNKQLELRDSENSKLLAFAEVAKQTITEMEKKITLLHNTLDQSSGETSEVMNALNMSRQESEEKDKLIQYLEQMTRTQLEQIKDFDKDLNVVNSLKTDLDTYNSQLTNLVTELSNKNQECEKLKKLMMEQSMMTEQFKNIARELESQLQAELDYKVMYNDLKTKVDEYTAGTTQNKDRNSPTRTLEDQQDNIRLREQNLLTYSQLQDLKEQLHDLQMLVKKKDRQIDELKSLIQESDNLRENFDKILKDKK